jgi:hypothetical protein
VVIVPLTSLALPIALPIPSQSVVVGRVLPQELLPVALALIVFSHLLHQPVAVAEQAITVQPFQPLQAVPVAVVLVEVLLLVSKLEQQVTRRQRHQAKETMVAMVLQVVAEVVAVVAVLPAQTQQRLLALMEEQELRLLSQVLLLPVLVEVAVQHNT